jgi:D-glycero-alpha-D-manno-heptose-7-phosphate kinase
LGGGSTDYPEFFNKFGCLIIGFTINLGVYVTLRATPSILDHKYLVSYSQTERCESFYDIKHPGARGVLEYYNCYTPVEISTLCDLPSRTGTGSSSCFIVALTQAVERLYNNKKLIDKKTLSKNAIHIERKLLSEPGGYQDSIHSAFGGFNSIEIKKGGDFYVRPMPISKEFLAEFKKNALLLYIGEARDSFGIAASHGKHSEDHKQRILDKSYKMYEYFVQEDLDGISQVLKESWKEKRAISDKISNNKVDSLIGCIEDQGGACKLLGAGGGGFLFVLAPPKKHLDIIGSCQLQKVNWDFDFNGAKIIHNGNP